MRAVSLGILGVGAFLCAMNFYLSFLRYPLQRLLGRKDNYRFVSGVPLLGSLLVVPYLLGPDQLGMPGWVRIAAFVLAAFDTGGPHWFIGVTLWRARKTALRGRDKER